MAVREGGRAAVFETPPAVDRELCLQTLERMKRVNNKKPDPCQNIGERDEPFGVEPFAILHLNSV